ncbi:MAG: hypothetical protein PW792_16315 [Acidobacteriaceae bacterium]|nr:hypothetical protein [Acidobacteriaceae bacterium]
MRLPGNIVAVLFSLSLTGLATAQDATPPPQSAQVLHMPQPETYEPALATAMASAARQEQKLRTTLPSFTCKEQGVSQLLRNDEVRKEVPFTGVIRAVRQPDGQIEETHEFTTIKGRPVGKHPEVPYYVHDAFTRVLTYVSAAYQPCYHFTVSDKDPRRINFVNRRPFNVMCENYPGTEGFFTWDESGQINHLERLLPEVNAEGWPVPFAAVDISTVQLGEKSYRLASHMESEKADGKDIEREDVNFTDCKLFKATIRILPDATEVQDGNPPDGNPKDEPAPLRPR